MLKIHNYNYNSNKTVSLIANEEGYDDIQVDTSIHFIICNHMWQFRRSAKKKRNN